MQSHSEVLWVTISTYEFWQGVIQAIRDNLQQLELGAASLDDRTKTKVTVVETNSFSFSLKTGGRHLRASTAAPWSSEVQDPAPPLHLECHFMAQIDLQASTFGFLFAFEEQEGGKEEGSCPFLLRGASWKYYPILLFLSHWSTIIPPKEARKCSLFSWTGFIHKRE